MATSYIALTVSRQRRNVSLIYSSRKILQVHFTIFAMPAYTLTTSNYTNYDATVRLEIKQKAGNSCLHNSVQIYLNAEACKSLHWDKRGKMYLVFKLLWSVSSFIVEPAISASCPYRRRHACTIHVTWFITSCPFPCRSC